MSDDLVHMLNILASRGVRWDIVRADHRSGVARLLWGGWVYVFRFFRYSPHYYTYYREVADFIRRHQWEVGVSGSHFGGTVYVDEHLKRQKGGGSVQRGQGLHDRGRSREEGRPFF